MSEYTPTTQEIKKFAAEMLGWDLADPDAAFDRWLAEERRAAAEKAWDEGEEAEARNRAQEEYRDIGLISADRFAEVLLRNPYRAKETKA